jgi:hypothetical protein
MSDALEEILNVTIHIHSFTRYLPSVAIYSKYWEDKDEKARSPGL